MYQNSRVRTKVVRTLSISAVALGLLTILVSPALSAHTVPLGASGTDQSGECEGDYFKIESASVLEEGTHTYTGTTKDGAAFSVTLTVVFDDEDEVDSITIVSSTPAVDKVVIGSAGEFVVYDPPVAGMTGFEGHAISNVAFCLAGAEGSPTPTPTPTATPTPTPTPTPLGGTPTPTPTPTPAGGGEDVAGGTPRAAAGALPSTATAPQPVSGPAIIASIVLLSSLGALAYRRLSDDRLRGDR